MRYKLNLQEVTRLCTVLENNMSYVIEWKGVSPFQVSLDTGVESFGGTGRLVGSLTGLEMINNYLVASFHCKSKEGVFKHIPTQSCSLSVLGFGSHWDILGS